MPIAIQSFSQSRPRYLRGLQTVRSQEVGAKVEFTFARKFGSFLSGEANQGCTSTSRSPTWVL